MKRFRVYVDYDNGVRHGYVHARNAYEARIVAEFDVMVEGLGGIVVHVEQPLVCV